MRKLLAAGVIAAAAIGVSLQAGATTTVYDIDGSFGSVEESCTQIAFLFSGRDCTFGRNRPGTAESDPDIAPENKWSGPLFGGGHYNLDGVKDQVTYSPTAGRESTSNPGTLLPATDDGKIAAPITGTLSIDDNGTPSDGSDDRISAAFSIGTMARNIRTGQATKAVQRWTSMDHVMAAVTVSSATSNGGGGFDYVIGSRGFPAPLCNSANSSDCFPSQNSVDTATFNEPTFWATIPQRSVGIERDGQMGDPNFVLVQPPPSPPTGNVGASTTATFNGLSCSTNNTAADDCAVSPLIWGGGEPAGFDNIVLKISTNNAGAITSALAYYSEEYRINFGGAAPGYDNSSQTGGFSFTGLTQDLSPNARDFAASVIQGSSNNTLDTVANSVNFVEPPVTVTIISGPTLGTASVNGNQTINYNSTGGTGTDTIVYEATDGLDTDQGTITITVAPDISPVAPDGSITISTQGAAPAGTPGNVNVATLATYSPGNTPSVVTITTPPNAGSGAATVNGTTITFVPAAGFFAGTATIGYTITDSNGDTDTGEIAVDIPDLTPAIQDGALTTDQDTPSPPLSLGITPGNGSVAQHTLTVTTQGTNGLCSITGTSLRYTPTNADFFGTDSCVVTIADGNGDTDTGTITITVNEVSSSLKLPGGGGAVDPWSLSLLGGLLLLRRRRRASV